MKNCRHFLLVALAFLAVTADLTMLDQTAALAKKASPSADKAKATDQQPSSDLSTSSVSSKSADPLPSWTEGTVKQRLISFVKETCDPSSQFFVPAIDRYASFDNDGTILCEKPTFFESICARDRAKGMQNKHPEWTGNAGVQEFLNATDDGLASVKASVAMSTYAQTNAGLTLEQVHEESLKWLNSAKQKRFDVLYKQLYYQPMIELLNLLRANDFKIYICTGGQTEFVRCYSQDEYGVAPAQVIGSNMEMEFTSRFGRSELEYKPKFLGFNVGPNKPISISQHIGKRPILACGNSDGDLQMLAYVADSKGPNLSILIHHDDPDREYQYDSGAEKVLEAATQKGWLIVSMKSDFAKMFSFQK